MCDEKLCCLLCTCSCYTAGRLDWLPQRDACCGSQKVKPVLLSPQQKLTSLSENERERLFATVQDLV